MKTKISVLSVVLGLLLFSCQRNTPTENHGVKKGMIKVPVLYPSGEGKTFDIDSYVYKHIPTAESALGDSFGDSD